MLANYLIGLREGLEAALVVSILVAYLTRTGRRALLPALWTGVAVATAGSLAFGALLTFGPRELSERAQEVIGGLMSLAAVALITWMVFWMAHTARHLKADLHQRLDGAIQAGAAAVAAMALVAVGREGLETALFLWAGAQAAGSSSSPLLGGAAGIATAVLLGWAVYRGALRLDLRAFFAWTGVFLVIVAAGVLVYAVHELQEAAIFPGEAAVAFDVSTVIPPESWLGALLRGVLNITPVMTWLQVGAWVGYVVPVLTVFVRTVWAPSRPAVAVPSAQAGEHATTSQAGHLHG